MLEEVPILTRQQRLDQMGRDLLDANNLAFLVAEEFGDQAPVTIQYPGGQSRSVALVHVETANVAGSGDGNAADGSHHQRHQQAERDLHPGKRGSAHPFRLSGGHLSAPKKRNGRPPRWGTDLPFQVPAQNEVNWEGN